MDNLTTLEREVIDKLLEGQHPVLIKLREQVKRAHLIARENTGAGFYCRFRVDDDAPMVHGTFRLGDVKAAISGVKHGAGFLLLVKDGRINTLEGYTFDQPWPDRIHHFTLQYSDPSRKAELAKIR